MKNVTLEQAHEVISTLADLASAIANAKTLTSRREICARVQRIRYAAEEWEDGEKRYHVLTDGSMMRAALSTDDRAEALKRHEELFKLGCKDVQVWDELLQE